MLALICAFLFVSFLSWVGVCAARRVERKRHAGELSLAEPVPCPFCKEETACVVSYVPLPDQFFDYSRVLPAKLQAAQYCQNRHCRNSPLCDFEDAWPLFRCAGCGGWTMRQSIVTEERCRLRCSRCALSYDVLYITNLAVNRCLDIFSLGETLD